MLAMLEAAACEQDWKIGPVVAIGVAEVTAEQDHGVVEQWRAAFGLLLERVEQFVEGAHFRHLDELELANLFRILAVMGKIVVVDRDAGHGRDVAAALHENRDEPRAVGLQRERHELEEKLEPA